MEKLTICHLLKQLSFLVGVLEFQESVSRTTKFCTATSNIGKYWVWNLLRFTLPVPRSLRWLLDFWKLCVLLVHVVRG